MNDLDNMALVGNFGGKDTMRGPLEDEREAQSIREMTKNDEGRLDDEENEGEDNESEEEEDDDEDDYSDDYDEDDDFNDEELDALEEMKRLQALEEENATKKQKGGKTRPSVATMVASPILAMFVVFFISAVICITNSHYSKIVFGQTILRAMMLFSSSLQTGADLYINLAEHPSRVECGPEVALQDFVGSYRNAARMLATLAMTATVTSFIAYFTLEDSEPILCCAILSALIIVFSLVVVLPVDIKLLDPNRNPNSPETIQLFDKWGQLHTIRTLAAAFCTIIVLSTILYDNPQINAVFH